jgi:hypothetical protein
MMLALAKNGDCEWAKTLASQACVFVDDVVSALRRNNKKFTSQTWRRHFFSLIVGLLHVKYSVLNSQG